MEVGLLLCVIDSNIMIDLEEGDILEALFQLPLYLVTSDPVIQERRDPERQILLSYGLKILHLESEQMEEVGQLYVQHSRLSLPDVSACILARETNAILLTGDQELRNLAVGQNVIAHGALWVLDEMIDHSIISPVVASESLASMLQAGSFLPLDECRERLLRWKHFSEREIDALLNQG